MLNYSRSASLVDIESRIKRMESVITAFGLKNHCGDTMKSTSGTPPPSPCELNDRLSTLVFNEEGSSRFYGIV